MYVRAVKSRGRTFHYWARKERDPATGRWVERKIRRLTDDEVKRLTAKATSMATTPHLLATAQSPNSPEETAPMATTLPMVPTREVAAPPTPPPSLQTCNAQRTELARQTTQLLETFGYRAEYHGEVSVGRLYKLMPKVAGLKVGHILIANDGEITCACSRGECEHTQAVRRAIRVGDPIWLSTLDSPA
jgi:hypothetical protein